MKTTMPLVALVLVLGFILVLMAACQSPRSGQQPSCLFNCTLSPPAAPAAPAEAATADEEIIIPPSRRPTIIRRFAQ